MPAKQNIYGWDTTNWKEILVDGGGRLQVDVVGSGLPTGAATAAHQVTTHGYIDGIEGLFGAGLPVALDATALKVREQNWPATYPLPAADIAALQAVDVGNFPAEYPLPAAQVALLQAVTVGNFPADYPLPAAQVATLQQVTEQNPLVGFATSANQVTIIGHIDGIETLLGAGLPVALDATALKVKEQSPIAGFATSANQTTMITALQLIDDLRNALGSVNTDDLQVDIKDIADGEIKCYGYDGTNWQTLLVESDALKNLRVKLYDGANGIDSAPLSDETIADALRGLVVNSALRLAEPLYDYWAEWRNARVTTDNTLGTYFPSVALMGFDGSTYDRLRTWGTGVLKVGRAEIDSTTVRKTAAGAVVAGAHNLYWIACSPDSPSAEWELTDAIAGGGAVVYDHFDPDKHSEHLIFDPPMKFTTGIYIEKFDHMHSLVFCYV